MLLNLKLQQHFSILDYAIIATIGIQHMFSKRVLNIKIIYSETGMKYKKLSAM